MSDLDKFNDRLRAIIEDLRQHWEVTDSSFDQHRECYCFSIEVPSHYFKSSNEPSIADNIELAMQRDLKRQRAAAKRKADRERARKSRALRYDRKRARHETAIMLRRALAGSRFDGARVPSVASSLLRYR